MGFVYAHNYRETYVGLNKLRLSDEPYRSYILGYYYYWAKACRYTIRNSAWYPTTPIASQHPVLRRIEVRDRTCEAPILLQKQIRRQCSIRIWRHYSNIILILTPVDMHCCLLRVDWLLNRCVQHVMRRR